MEPVMSMMAKRTKKAPTISMMLIMIVGFLYGLYYFSDGLGDTVESNRVAGAFPFESHINGSLCTNGEEDLLRDGFGRAIRNHELPRSDAEEEVLAVCDNDGSVLGFFKGGMVEKILQNPDAGIGIGELFGIHVASAHHFGTVGVVAVDIGTIVVALLLSRLHFLFGSVGQLLLLLKACLDDLYAALLSSHNERL